MDRQSLPVDVQFAGSGRESGNSPVANAGSASAISTLVAKSNGSAANSEITSKIGESVAKRRTAPSGFIGESSSH